MLFDCVVTQFANEQFGPGIQVKMVPLRGGLESPGIMRADVRRQGARVGSFVAKPLLGASTRELHVYRLLERTARQRMAPALLGWHAGQDQEHIFLEWVAGQSRWPWRNFDSLALVIEQLASLHGASAEPVEAALAEWDYEAELRESAYATLEAYNRMSFQRKSPAGRPATAALARITEALPRLRGQLLAFAGTTLLHGDAHPGNVVLTRGNALLLDWSRARIGSALEDVCSWVHSVSFWEPEAKRRHDSLLRRYLLARGLPAALSRDFRDACSLAGASNALSGALHYHLAVLEDPKTSRRAKDDSHRAAADWLRLIRRADTCFREGPVRKRGGAKDGCSRQTARSNRARSPRQLASGLHIQGGNSSNRRRSALKSFREPG
jgi:aminoglycoside phosphotransferase (APT) family kinase protein